MKGGEGFGRKTESTSDNPCHTFVLRGVYKTTLDRFDDLLKSQLNVKQVLFEDNSDNFTQREFLLNAKKLGPVLKNEFKHVSNLVKEGKFEYYENGSLKVGDHLIVPDDYSGQFSPPPLITKMSGQTKKSPYPCPWKITQAP